MPDLTCILTGTPEGTEVMVHQEGCEPVFKSVVRCVYVVLKKERGHYIVKPPGTGDMLGKAGYVFSIDKAVYFNKHTRKVFSDKYIDSHSAEKIQKDIDYPSCCEWIFYFVGKLTDKMKAEILGAINV